MVTEAISPEFLSKLEARGVSRRSFMKLCGSLAVAAGLSELAAPRVARAIEDSVIGHLLVIGAERSRKNHANVSFDDLFGQSD